MAGLRRAALPAGQADTATPHGAARTAARGGGASAQRRVPSSELFAGAQEIEIVHREQVYRLRQTALGKLILTK
jgi:hemin uptake protein HemP